MTVMVRCVLCDGDYYFEGQPSPLWAPCACNGSHYVCARCVGQIAMRRMGALCPASDELHLALELMGRRL